MIALKLRSNILDFCGEEIFDENLGDWEILDGDLGNSILIIFHPIFSIFKEGI